MENAEDTSLADEILRDYLSTNGYSSTLSAFNKHTPRGTPDQEAAESFVSRSRNAHESMLGTLVNSAIEPQSKPRKELARPSTAPAGGGRWSSEETSRLKRALKKYPDKNPGDKAAKNERWKRIAKYVGRGRRECYEYYKKLREERVRRKESGGGGSSKRDESSRRSSRSGSSDKRSSRRGSSSSISSSISSGTPTAADEASVARSDWARAERAERAARSGWGDDGDNDDDDDWGLAAAGVTPRYQAQRRGSSSSISGGGGSEGKRRETGSSSSSGRSGARRGSAGAWGGDDTPAAAGMGRRGSGANLGGGLEVEERDDFENDFLSQCRPTTAPSMGRRGSSSSMGGSGSAGMGRGGGEGKSAGAAYVAKFKLGGGGGGLSGTAYSKVAAAGGRMPAGGSASRVSSDEVKAIRDLCFGSRRPNAFNDNWLKQGVLFCEEEGLGYGLVQMEGGPCGAIAALQAATLVELLFAGSGDACADWRRPTAEEQAAALVRAIVTILWRAGDERGAALAVAGGGTAVRVPGYRSDGVTGKLVVHRFRSKQALTAAVWSQLPALAVREGPGVVLLVYSAILSRGVERVGADMDNALGMEATMVGAHNYAAQEMVSLLLCGAAHSQVFDGEKVLEDEGKGSDRVVLRGPTQRAEVGFLTLFEHYGYVAVGEHLKVPRHPVWVVCSESHYSVLFSPDRAVLHSADNPAAGQVVDLFYYDELAMQDEEIRLSLALLPTPQLTECELGKCEKKVPKCRCIQPPLDLVLRTKWPARVDWNDTEPLL